MSRSTVITRHRRRVERRIGALSRCSVPRGSRSIIISNPADPRAELDYGYLFWGREYPTPCGRAAGRYMSGNGGNHVLALPALGGHTGALQ